MTEKTPTRTEPAECGYPACLAEGCNKACGATPTRTEFEAAALTNDQIISLAVRALPDANPFDTRYEFTETQLCAFVRSAIAAHAAQTERERFEAAAYRWLRDRLMVREEKSLAGSYRDSIYTRVGRSFFDTPSQGAKGYLDPSKYEKECGQLDIAIAAAMGWPTVPEVKS